ncbi:MAG: hypothetical protein L0Y71_04200 [Gemmataceae bacterium]|nr:hypothetical protein [Gemmataceae bacterium]
MRTEQENDIEPRATAHEYAQLLLQLHALMAEGNEESAEAESIRERMERPWYAMMQQEQERMRGLSSDLYALHSGSSRTVTMSQKEIEEWARQRDATRREYEVGNVDPLLQFFRKAVPDVMPRFLVPFMQFRCWEKLGELEIGLVFLKEAEKFEPKLRPLVLWMLERTGKSDEANEYATRILNDAESVLDDRLVSAG